MMSLLNDCCRRKTGIRLDGPACTSLDLGTITLEVDGCTMLDAMHAFNEDLVPYVGTQFDGSAFTSPCLRCTKLEAMLDDLVLTDNLVAGVIGMTLGVDGCTLLEAPFDGLTATALWISLEVDGCTMLKAMQDDLVLTYDLLGIARCVIGLTLEVDGCTFLEEPLDGITAIAL